jgi:hypothetical protein
VPRWPSIVLTPAIEKFVSRFEVSEEHMWNNSACWIWTAGTTCNGYQKYASFRADGKMIRGHVFSYRYFVGEIPQGLELDHLCRNTLCVNPDHLEAVTHSVNIKRGLTPIRARERAALRTHCPSGHPYDEVNTYWWNGTRYCKICLKTRDKIRGSHHAKAKR